MRLLLSICFASTGLVLSPMTSSAASVDETLASTRAELKAALQELSTAQEAIGQEKIPLAKRLNTLEEELAANRMGPREVLAILFQVIQNSLLP